jgi:hypothetical protein
MATPPRGLSLHVGLNRVDGTKYHDRDGKPWDGALATCEADARDLAALAQSQGFVPTVLLTADATADAIVSAIGAAAQTLVSGDMFLLTYSGHGGSVDDLNGDEDDGKDETWVLYDRQLVDDEIYQALTGFRPGVRVLALSDSCHSGTVMRRHVPPGAHPPSSRRKAKAKAMPKDVADADQEARARLYASIQRSVPDASASIAQLEADVLLLSACSDKQLAYVGPRHSVFTGVVLRMWDRGTFQGSYRDFYQAVLAAMPSDQTPQWSPPAQTDPPFVAQRPFTI